MLKEKMVFIYIFYKSTLLVNIAVSLLLSVIGFAYFFQIFGISFVIGGPVLGLLYKELTQSNQYYFYYNKGISKAALLISCTVLNIIIGTIIYNLGGHE